jgi:hypothetical protein
MSAIDPTSALLRQSFAGPPPISPVSQMILVVRPLAVAPTSSERIRAQADAIRHRGISFYA